MLNINKKFLQTPTEVLFYLYNISICIFIMFNFTEVSHGFFLLTMHLLIMAIYFYITSLRLPDENAKRFNNYIKIFFIIASLTFLHYETGVLNLIIFPHYFDESVQALNLKIFGFPVNEIARNHLRHNFFVQTFHFFYINYYLMLFLPVFLIYRKQSQFTIEFTGPTERSLFLLLFTMFACYWIFIVFPVVGPIETHYQIFKGYGGFVRLLDYLYEYGDSAGGAMPSSHMAVSLVVTIFSFRHLKKLAPYILFSFVMLTISTVYCSFHYGIDALAGILAGFIFYYIGKNIHGLLKNKLKG